MTEESATSRVMNEIYDIRLRIYEDIKNMTPEEMTAYFEKAVSDAEKKHGLKFRRAPVRDAG